jgi:AcrR family transcriptional regulator
MPDSAQDPVPPEQRISAAVGAPDMDSGRTPLPEEALVREPLQDRSRRTLERLVAAAARLLEARGPEGVTVTGVSREARTSVGAFYARFSGKEEMVRYLGERWLTEALARWEEVTTSLEPGDLVALRGGIAELATLYLNGPARRLTLLDGQDDPSPRRLRRFEDRVAETLSGVAGGSPPRAPRQENGEVLDQTRFLRAAVLVAGLRELGLRAVEGSGPSAGLGPGALAEIMMGLPEALGTEPAGRTPADGSGEAPEPEAGTDRGEGSEEPRPTYPSEAAAVEPAPVEAVLTEASPEAPGPTAPEEAGRTGETDGPEERPSIEGGPDAQGKEGTEEPEIFDVWG